MAAQKEKVVRAGADPPMPPPKALIPKKRMSSQPPPDSHVRKTKIAAASPARKRSATFAASPRTKAAAVGVDVFLQAQNRRRQNNTASPQNFVSSGNNTRLLHPTAPSPRPAVNLSIDYGNPQSLLPSNRPVGNTAPRVNDWIPHGRFGKLIGPKAIGEVWSSHHAYGLNHIRYLTYPKFQSGKDDEVMEEMVRIARKARVNWPLPPPPAALVYGEEVEVKRFDGNDVCFGCEGFVVDHGDGCGRMEG